MLLNTLITGWPSCRSTQRPSVALTGIVVARVYHNLAVRRVPEKSGRQGWDFALRNGDHHQVASAWHFGNGDRLGASLFGQAGKAFRASRIGDHHVVHQAGEMPSERRADVARTNDSNLQFLLHKRLLHMLA